MEMFSYRSRADECAPHRSEVAACGCIPVRLRLSCNTRRMAETAAHLVDHVLPRLPVRQWLFSLPKRLRYSLKHDREALNCALRIFLDEIEPPLRVHSPGAGPNARPGAVAFLPKKGCNPPSATSFKSVS
jgi:hypothetical protein